MTKHTLDSSGLGDTVTIGTLDRLTRGFESGANQCIRTSRLRDCLPVMYWTDFKHFSLYGFAQAFVHK